MTVRVTVRGGAYGDNPFAKFDWLKRATAWADEVGPPVRDAMKRAAPVGQGPGAGQLRDKLKYDRKTTSKSVQNHYGTGVGYAKWVVGGAKPHVIRPRSAQALRFYAGPVGVGAAVFARSVNHPGNKPNRFPKRAIEEAREQMQRKIGEIMRERT